VFTIRILGEVSLLAAGSHWSWLRLAVASGGPDDVRTWPPARIRSRYGWRRATGVLSGLLVGGGFRDPASDAAGRLRPHLRPSQSRGDERRKAVTDDGRSAHQCIRPAR
jgi:hypothetical protein